MQEIKPNSDNEGNKVAVDIGELETKAQRVLAAKQGVENLAGRMEAILAEIAEQRRQLEALREATRTESQAAIVRIQSERSIALGRIAAARVEAINAIKAARPASPQHDEDSVESLINSPSGSFSG
jgi:hypothetical protein